LMRLSDRYAMREAISPFLFGIAAFTAIFVASDIVFKVADLVASGSAGLADVIMLLLYKLPYVATLTFPMAMLLGSLLGMARLSSTHELVAFRACGLSIARLTLPILVFSFFVFLFSLFVGEALVPRAARAEFELTNRILNRTEAWLQGDDLVQQRKTASGLELVHIGRLRDELISDVVVVEIKDSGEVTITRAEEAVWDSSSWYYGMGSTVVVSPDGLSRVVPPELDEIIPSTAMTFEGVYRKLPLEDSPAALSAVAQDARPESMTYHQLKLRIDSMLERGVSQSAMLRDRLHLYTKISLPFSSIVFALIGLPLGIQPNRSGGSIGFGLSILIILVYYVIMTLGRAMGESGSLPPILAAWLPNIVIGGVGVWLLVSADQGLLSHR
jgi:lipopolysaccharide export system permease protein